MSWVSQVMHIKLPVPIGQHRLMIVCPRFFASHGLNVMNANYRFQSSIMTFWTSYSLTRIMHYITIVSYQLFHQFFVSHEHRSMFMTYREVNRSRLVLEMNKVLCSMCPVNLMSIRIIINIPPIAYLCCTWSFGKRLGKRF